MASLTMEKWKNKFYGGISSGTTVKLRIISTTENKIYEYTLDSCQFCIEAPRFRKHCVVACGNSVYLSSVPWRHLVKEHCLIVPNAHYSSTVTLDEDVYEEIRKFKKALVSMWQKKEMECLFVETAKNVKYHRHMYIECIAVPNEIGEMAPIYFKKAIDDSEDEWVDNKKLIDLTKRDGDVRKVIPKGFSYFAIDFGLQPGYAHIIENEDRFPQNFAHEIIGGMIDLERRQWRMNESLTVEEQRINTAELKISQNRTSLNNAYCICDRPFQTAKCVECGPALFILIETNSSCLPFNAGRGGDRCRLFIARSSSEELCGYEKFVHNEKELWENPAAIRINDEYDEFDHTHAYIARRTLARVPLLAENNTYRVIFQQEKGYNELLRKPSQSSENSRVECPGFRRVPDLEPLRATPRYNIEVCTDKAYLKRHEKYEKQEKLIKRRDRIRQREEQYRLHLMKVEKPSASCKPKIESIEVVEKKPRFRKH
ncbi:CWF19-like protein [Dirofilaria immitis]